MGAQLTSIDHRPGIQLREFLTRMDLAYAVADVVVSRAGALAISRTGAGKKAGHFCTFAQRGRRPPAQKTLRR